MLQTPVVQRIIVRNAKGLSIVLGVVSPSQWCCCLVLKFSSRQVACPEGPSHALAPSGVIRGKRRSSYPGGGDGGSGVGAGDKVDIARAPISVPHINHSLRYRRGLDSRPPTPAC